MLSKAGLCVAIAVPVTLVLQGCGDGGAPAPAPAPTPDKGPATEPPTSPTTTTTTTTKAPTPGWSSEEAVQELNAMYMAFNEFNDSTALGVTISYAGQVTSFGENIFCEGYSPQKTHCYRGQADCRISGAVLNHRVMTRRQNEGVVVVPALNRAIGYVFNQTLVENYFGKCTYLFDGAASFNVNQGCGAIAPPPNDCNNSLAAFYNLCTSDGGESYHHCIATDPEIISRKCKCEPCDENRKTQCCDTSYGEIPPPRFKSDETCFYEMPALIVPHDDPESFTPSGTNHLRDAMKQRVSSDNQTNQNQEWNEVILDDRLLLPQIEKDPTHTIVAFFYVAGGSMSDEIAQTYATDMRDKFQETYGVRGVGDIPVVELDARNDFSRSGGPFKLPSSPSRVVV